MSELNWYYVEDGNYVGPIDEATVRQRFRDGKLSQDDLVWQEGMPDWIKAGDVTGLLPPPIPSDLQKLASTKLPPFVTDKPQPTSSKDNNVVAPPLLLSGEVFDSTNSAFSTQQQAEGISLAFAGFWKRLAAFVIDYIISFAVIFVLFFILALIGALDTYDLEEVELIGNCIGILTWWLYFAGMESSRHQGTLGKMAVGIKVIDLSGQPISFGRASGRHFGKFISAITLCIGFLIAAFTPKKQSLHDMIAGCLVVNKKAIGS